MTELYLKFHSVSFGYDSSVEQLFKDISFHAAKGWTGVVGANGTGKSTLLKLATGHLVPEKGAVEFPEHSIYCEQRTDDPPDNIAEFFRTAGKESNILKEDLQISEDWEIRWKTLSHGERKRVQLGTALWLNPDLLAVDEPTNHLDSYAKGLISDALWGYKGIGLLVSHDRELLDRLCRACVFTKPPSIILRPGGITRAGEALEQERLAAQREYDIRKSALRKARLETVRRKQEAQQKQAEYKHAKRNLAPKDHDSREKIDRARLSGRIGHAESLYRSLQVKSDRLHQEFDNIKIEKKNLLGVTMPGLVSKRDYILQLEAGSIPMGGGKQLSFPDLTVKPADRIAITGPNGGGKSTLIRYLLEHLNVDIKHVAYVPQEIDIADSKDILDRVLALSKDKLGDLMSIVSRLNSRPERLLFTAEPSPGEIRKLLLALGMLNEPQLIVMDEPTNHMDLPSIECLEEALSQSPCALILVSHDIYFLARLTAINWHLSSHGDGSLYMLENRNISRDLTL